MMTQPTHSEEFCERCWSFDPLADSRGPDDPPLDVITTGTVFFDIILSGLPRIPQPGEELWSRGMGSCPGGIANLATALARLGLRTGLVAGFGDDAYADWIWETLLEHEHINLATSPRFQNFHTALTVAMTVGGDRAMVTHGHKLPESLGRHMVQAPSSRVAVVDLRGDTSWWGELRSRGTTLFADIGFDESERWDTADLEPLRHCQAFTPNALEAMAYTRTDSPTRAVHKLAELVPFAVVTDEKTHTKIPIVSPDLVAGLAILDPEAVVGVPKHITADSGMDVLTHAIEAYVATNASDFSDALAEKAVELIFQHLARCYTHGDDEKAREHMHNASCMAAMAFDNAGLGIVHSLAHALGGHYPVAHGRLNALLLPHVIEFHAERSPQVAERYARLGRLVAPSATGRAAVMSLVGAVQKLRVRLEMPSRLSEAKVSSADLRRDEEELVRAALADGCTTTNPVAPTAEDLKAILRRTA